MLNGVIKMSQIKIENLIEYFKKDKTDKREVLYFLHLYNIKKSLKLSDDGTVNMEMVFKQLTKLNETLYTASNTKFVSERLSREIKILQKIQYILDTGDQRELNDVLDELTLLSFECDAEIEPKSANEVLNYKFSKGLTK